VSTAGFSRTARLTRCRISVIAGNEMSSTASAFTEIWPMSSVGKKPLGMKMTSATVATSVPNAASTTDRRWRRTTSSPRS
jgi:hypothetical protein